jgi:hypothetical protein
MKKLFLIAFCLLIKLSAFACRCLNSDCAIAEHPIIAARVIAIYENGKYISPKKLAKRKSVDPMEIKEMHAYLKVWNSDSSAFKNKILHLDIDRQTSCMTSVSYGFYTFAISPTPSGQDTLLQNMNDCTLRTAYRDKERLQAGYQEHLKKKAFCRPKKMEVPEERRN